MKVSNEMILFFNFQEPDIRKKWNGICFRLGIRVKEVGAEQFHQPLGFLAGLPGFEAGEQLPSDPHTFSEPMLVLKNFTSKRINELLRAGKKAGLPNVPLKAVLTAQNSTWNAAELHQELEKEHQAMQQGRTIHPDT